jgi:hopanoid biosynthesis associated RND transporter like protein HpnN
MFQNDIPNQSGGVLRCVLTRYYWLVLLLAAALTGASVYYTVTHLTVSTSRESFISGHSRILQRTAEFDKAFGGHDGLVVVVENHDRARSVEVANALAAELRRYPDRFPDLFYRVNPESFKPWALLYLGTQELQKIRDHLKGQQNLLTGLAADPSLTTFYRLLNEQIAQALITNIFTGFIAEKKAPGLPDVSLLNTTLKQLQLHLEGHSPYVSPFKAVFSRDLNDLSQEGYFFTENNKFLLFLVTPQPGGNYASAHRDVSLLRQVVDSVKARFPGIQMGVTGPIALQSDEMNRAMKDATLATWLSLAGQLGLLILFLRCLRRPLIEVLVLVIGLCWTFGVITLVVGRLNILSAHFAPLVLGLSIDYGIHWFCRLEEEEAHHRQLTLEALICAYRRTLPGLIYVGLADMVTFLPLALIGFKGLSELGLIMVLAILIMMSATLILAPCLVIATEKWISTGNQPQCSAAPQSFLKLTWNRPGVIAALGVAVLVLGSISLFHIRFDLNPLHLQNPRTESVVWENRILQESKYSTSFGVVVADSPEQLRAKTGALKQLSTVSQVESVFSFLPADVQEKRSLLKEMEASVASLEFPQGSALSNLQDLAAILRRINFKMQAAVTALEKADVSNKPQIEEIPLLINKIMARINPGDDPQVLARLADFERHFFNDLKGKWVMLRHYTKSALESPPMTVADLPQPVRDRFVSQGSYLIRVFPSQDSWNFEPLKKFVESLWSVDPDAVGDRVLLFVFTQGFRNSILWSAALAIVAITLMLTVIYRSWQMALLALIPLGIGTGLTLNCMWLLDLPFNQANILFLPLILGEGIQFGIIILTRWRLEESARAIVLPASTAKGVILAALTTTVGFGSLMVSGHQGTFSLGLLATIGSLSALLISVSVLPAFLHLVGRRLKPAPPLVYSTPILEPEADEREKTSDR